MSLNTVNKETGELITTANGTRIWCGTKTAHDLAVQQGTMPNNCMVCITDDYFQAPNLPVYVKTVTGTTTPSGNIQLTLSIENSEIPLSAYSQVDASSSTQFACNLYCDNNTQNRDWYAHCVSLDATPVALVSTTVTLVVLYTKFTSMEES